MQRKSLEEPKTNPKPLETWQTNSPILTPGGAASAPKGKASPSMVTSAASIEVTDLIKVFQTYNDLNLRDLRHSFKHRGGIPILAIGLVAIASQASRLLFILAMTVELPIKANQAAFTNRPCGSSTNLAAMPLSN